MILLDTSVLIRLVGGGRLAAAALEIIAAEAAVNGLLVSAVTAWEIGLLAKTRNTGLLLRPDGRTWFAAAAARPGIRLLPMTAEVAIAAGDLPGAFHADSGDRLLVATARDEDVAIVTSDRLILDYAAAGHVRAIAA